MIIIFERDLIDYIECLVFLIFLDIFVELYLNSIQSKCKLPYLLGSSEKLILTKFYA
jgi:hypothetical protein